MMLRTNDDSHFPKFIYPEYPLTHSLIKSSLFLRTDKFKGPLRHLMTLRKSGVQIWTRIFFFSSLSLIIPSRKKNLQKIFIRKNRIKIERDTHTEVIYVSLPHPHPLSPSPSVSIYISLLLFPFSPFEEKISPFFLPHNSISIHFFSPTHFSFRFHSYCCVINYNSESESFPPIFPPKNSFHSLFFNFFSTCIICVLSYLFLIFFSL